MLACDCTCLFLQSEAETKAAVEALKKARGGGSQEEQGEESEEGGAPEEREQGDIQEVQTPPPPDGGGARQRQTRRLQEGLHDTEAHPPRSVPRVDPAPQPKGTTSLVVMWLLIIMIFLLVGRRAYLSYSTEDLKTLHP